MSTRNFNILIQTLEEYRRRLAVYSEEDFLLKTNPDVWSPAEVYAHILSANRLTVRGMQKAAEGNATEDPSKLGLKAFFILTFERFPKGRKVPEVVLKRTPKFNSITDAKEALEALVSELNKIWESNHSWSKTQKQKHPALGMLNNWQWIKFMKIHSKHHLKQLDRISASVS
jgi:hypothetical protein